MCSAKVCLLVHCTLFISLRNSPKLLSGTSLHTFVENGIKEDEKLFQLLSKKAAVLILFRMGFFGPYTLPKEDPKNVQIT